MDKEVIWNKQGGFMEDSEDLCLAAPFSFCDGITAYMDSGEKQLVWILTWPRPLTQVSKCIFASRSQNYPLDWWLYIWMEFLQDLKAVVQGLRPNQELVTSGQGWWSGQHCLMSSLKTWTMFDTPGATPGKAAQYWIPPTPEIPAHCSKSSGCWGSWRMSKEAKGANLEEAWNFGGC